MTLSALARCTSVDPAVFAAEHWSRTPLLSRAKELPTGSFADLLSVADVDELVADRALRTPFFRTVREGGGLPTPVRTVTAGARRIGDLVDGDALREQHAEGATLVLQSVHRMHPPVARFCRELAAELGHATQCNAYITPGRRRAGLRLPPRHPRRVRAAGQRPQALDRARPGAARCRCRRSRRPARHLVPEGAEPLLDVELEAGDCLYLPRGYVHAALTTDEHSVHLTVGVLVDDLVRRARRRGDARRVRARPSATRCRCSRPARSRTCRRSCSGPRPGSPPCPPRTCRRCSPAGSARAVPPEPVGLLASAAALAALGPATALRPRRGLPVELVEGERTALRAPGKVLELPAVDDRRPCGSRWPARARSPTSPSAASTATTRRCWPAGCCARGCSSPTERVGRPRP